MFTGIIEKLGTVAKVEKNGGNLELYVASDLASELKIDQSVAHNGICLTVVEIFGDRTYRVTAIEETIAKTAIGDLQGRRPYKPRTLYDDGRAFGRPHCSGSRGSNWPLYFHKRRRWIVDFFICLRPSIGNVTVEKGSITVNGTSLTVVDSIAGGFSVAIIPYTYEHTVFHHLKVGDRINLEFDIIGKYVARMLSGYKK